ncbi:lysozyme-like protein [Rhizobium phage RHEph15]|uniref:Lysozyme-like protein n=1 Tax=Rhizobium phage RHph_TM34 TaxID=2509556 RepID=A0A7S5US64_9CAUD|nr:lysozyme-like protein [Rhizobium phage RHph_TM34]QXV74275.1 lysozyme-like protein [Rhizobium phage RHEph15]QXV74969.1 lysozyme-like protein [Rhizobium phage RHEph27]
MDKTIPGSAAAILNFISGPESRGNYDCYNSNVQDKLPKRLTSMTLKEVLAINWRSIGARSSAAGRYQIIRDTLLGLIAELKLPTSAKFTADLQDRLGYHLLRRRGYDAWTLGKIDTIEFAKRLAQEWASLPVLAGTKNYKNVNISRGSSYYAGDGLNKHGVTADEFQSALNKAHVYEERFSVAVPEKKTTKTVKTLIAASGVAVGGTGAGIASSDPSNLPDIGTVTLVASYAKDAWVVGPVFGGITLAAILAGGLWFFYSKK